MEFSLRSVGTADLDWLYQLKTESYQDVVIRQFGCWDEELQRKMFFDKWDPMHPAQIVLIGGVKAGVVAVDQKELYDWLGEIQITPEYRERGLGTSIIQWYVDQARSRGRPLRLQVLHENRRAKRLYIQLGFIEIKSLENHYLLEIK